MRNVTLVIEKLGLNVGDTIDITLVNSVGNLLLSNSGYMLDEKITLSSETFEIDILENEHIDSISSYQITLANNLSFTFNVPISKNNIPHDLLSLLRIGCVSEVIDKYTKELDSDFVKKINLYFTGENPYFSDTQKDVIKLYEYYADEIIDTDSTIDVIQMIDNSLAKIKDIEK